MCGMGTRLIDCTYTCMYMYVRTLYNHISLVPRPCKSQASLRDTLHIDRTLTWAMGDLVKTSVLGPQGGPFFSRTKPPSLMAAWEDRSPELNGRSPLALPLSEAAAEEVAVEEEEDLGRGQSPLGER